MMTTRCRSPRGRLGRPGLPAAVCLSLVALAPTAGHREASHLGAALPPAALSGRSCSAICLQNDGHAVFGANMDWADSDAGLVFVNKRNVRKTGYLTGTSGRVAEWVSRYASVTFNLVTYELAWGGMNEKGLTFSTMSGRPWTTAPPTDERPPLDSGGWFQYALDTCETVDEVLAAQTTARILTLDHYLVSDRLGQSAVIEFIGGAMVVHRGEGLPVAASSNTPYTLALANWYRKKQGLPWSDQDGSVVRFVTAADRVESFQSREQEGAIGYAFDTLHAIRGEQYSPHVSQWSIVFDARNLRAYFRTARYPAVRWVDLQGFDLDCGSPTEMLEVSADASGDVGALFAPLDYRECLDLFESFCRNWGIRTSPENLEAIVRHFAGYSCTTSAVPGPSSSSWRGVPAAWSRAARSRSPRPRPAPLRP